MTSKEFSLLRLLVTNANRVFTKKQLFEAVWRGVGRRRQHTNGPHSPPQTKDRARSVSA